MRSEHVEDLHARLLAAEQQLAQAPNLDLSLGTERPQRAWMQASKNEPRHAIEYKANFGRRK
jgi:hypothetical protein